MAPLVRTGGSRHTGLAALPHRNIQGVVMELKKSEVIWDIVRLIRLKVITYNDLSDFSDELQNEVKRILEMSR